LNVVAKWYLAYSASASNFSYYLNSFTDFSVEIQQVNGFRRGRVEIYNNGKRGLVCSNRWDSHDATVVCREKNLGTNGIATKLTYNKTEAVWLNGVDCVGNESQLSLCSHNGIEEVINCTFIAGVECFGKTWNYNWKLCSMLLAIVQFTYIPICL